MAEMRTPLSVSSEADYPCISFLRDLALVDALLQDASDDRLNDLGQVVGGERRAKAMPVVALGAAG